ncbi:MAG TPA: OsmC family protein [Nitrososphaerales archaeon]|nr:OsmC family protein [Nitrososphaerales archaeon]
MAENEARIEERAEPSPSLQPKLEDTKDYPVSVDWVEKMQFVGTDELGHSLVIDTSPEGGGENSGPTPVRLLLMAVACCTAMDVIDILKKSRQKLTGLSVFARGTQNKEYPRYFREIHLLYRLEGKGLEKSRVERAIKLSEEKYCSVGATVSGKAKILIKYEILENDEEN